MELQTTINDIQQQMNEHYQKNTTLRDENMELTTKLKGLIEQYELREQVSRQFVFIACVYWKCYSTAYLGVSEGFHQSNAMMLCMQAW